MKKYKISGVRSRRKMGKLVGILTNRDLRFETRFDIPISKVMTRDNLITVPVGTDMEQAEEILHEQPRRKTISRRRQVQPEGLITVRTFRKN